MNQRHLKVALRSFATVAGLFGIFDVFFGTTFLVSQVAGKKAPDPITIFFAAMFLIPGVYLAWLLFLVWRRFSPKAVLHCCGAIGFFVLLLPGSLFDRFDQRFGEIGRMLSALAFPVWLLSVIAGYQALSRYLVRRLFESEIPAGSPAH